MADRWTNRACVATLGWTVSLCGQAGGPGGTRRAVVDTVTARGNIAGWFIFVEVEAGFCGCFL